MVLRRQSQFLATASVLVLYGGRAGRNGAVADTRADGAQVGRDLGQAHSANHQTQDPEPVAIQLDLRAHAASLTRTNDYVYP